MKILYFIGNGFDLNLGLKTGYRDFYKYYKSLPSRNTAIEKFKRSLKEGNKNWADLEAIIGDYIGHFDLKNVNSFLCLLQDIKLNLKIYFKAQYGSLRLKELLIEKFLCDLAEPQKYLRGRDYILCELFMHDCDQSNYQIDIINFNYTMIIDWLYKKIQANYFLESKRMIYFKDGQIYQYSINDYLSQKIKTVYNINRPIHIHGTVQKTKSSKIILGVNDKSQINNGRLQNCERIINNVIKPSACAETNIKSCKKLIEFAELIVLFGVSLGVTDKMWWISIIEHLKKFNCRLIIFSYRQSKEEIIRKILSYDTSQEIDKIKTQIYVSENSEMFKIRNWSSFTK